MLQAKVVLPGEDPSAWPFPTPFSNFCWASLDLSSLGLTFKPQRLAEGGKALTQGILEHIIIHPSETYICTLQPLWRVDNIFIFIFYNYLFNLYLLYCMFCCGGIIHLLAHSGILDYSLHTLYTVVSKWISVWLEMWTEYSPYSNSSNVLFSRNPRTEGWRREDSVWKCFYVIFEEFRLVFQ